MKQFISSLSGILTTPAETVCQVMESKNWAWTLLFILVVHAIFTYALFPITITDRAKVIRDMPIADQMSEEQLQSMSTFTPAKRVFQTFTQAIIMGIILLLGAFFIYLFYKIGGVEGIFTQFFAGMLCASLLDLFYGRIISAVLTLVKKTSLVSTSLTLFVPNLPFSSFLYIFLSQFDFFIIAYLIVLALGIARFGKISNQKSMAIALFYFLFKTTILTLVSFLGMKLASGMTGG